MFFTRLFRFTRVFLRLGIFFFWAGIIKLLVRDPVRQRQKLIANTSRTARRMLRIFRMRVNLENPANLEILRRGNHLVVSNHVSYTDILVLASLHPFVFITSLEMAANPVLGDITKMGGCLFTNRKQHASLPREIEKIAATLGQGFNVILFAEATSTNGVTVKPMKKSLFQTSILAQKPVLPVCIRYLALNGKPILTQAQRDIVCWYDRSMNFIRHLWTILAYKIEVAVTVLETVCFDPAQSRQELCEQVYDQILGIFHNRQPGPQS